MALRCDHIITACCLTFTSCASGLASGAHAVDRSTVFLNKRTFKRTKIMAMGAGGAADAKRRQVVAALKRFDQLAAMSSRGDPEGCSTALTELEALRETGAVFALGPNAHNRAMRVCSTDLETVESLYAQLAAEDRQDAASLEALASIRLENDMLVEAAEALAELLAPALEVRTNKLGRVLPRRKVSSDIHAARPFAPIYTLPPLVPAAACTPRSHYSGPSSLPGTRASISHRPRRARGVRRGGAGRGRAERRPAAVGAARRRWALGASASATSARAHPGPAQARLSPLRGGGRGGGPSSDAWLPHGAPAAAV